MNVLVERYQRRKYVNKKDSQLLYYVRQKTGTVRVMNIHRLADAIETYTALTAGDVKHVIEAFVEQLRLSLTQGDKVKIDGLGTFHITLCSEGTEKEKDCTVRCIRRVNVRFVADKALHLVNTSHTATRGENNVDFVLAGKGEENTDSDSGDGGNEGGGGETPDPAA
ncbi:HU family DNA-binding protein [uncultured Bacteroides sp.]|uniref:HU family DNA-binding protein n=1 Tax=uncultured Bacteroides sp. TaxID=162156 RepID=UPI0025E7C8E8|nr:HU family DNA-binding protein [uncultured Bacteroides sp.]